MKRIWVLALVIVFAVVGLLLWRSSNDPSDKQISGKAPATIRFQLQWFDQAQFAGFYVAKQKGFYRDERLDVTLLEGGFQKDPISIVDGNFADIGLATGDQVLLAAQAKNIVALGSVYEHSLLRLMSRTGTQISSPRDLIGHSVAYYKDYDSDNIVRALLRQNGIDSTAVRLEPAGATSLQRFRQGQLDVYPAYVINEPLDFQPNEIALLDPSQFGVHFLSDTYFVRDGFLATHRDEVVRFLRASRRGWEYAIAHPDSAIDMMFAERGRVARDTDRAVQLRQLRVAIEHLNRGSAERPFFGINLEDWEQMRSNLERLGKDVSRRTDAVVNTRPTQEASR